MGRPCTLPPGPGRPKGLPNKITSDVKAMVLKALEAAGGVKYLQQQAEDNPTAFLSLVGKVLPLQVTGDDGGPVVIRVCTGVPTAESEQA